MGNKTIWTHKNNLLLTGLLLAMVACSGGGGGDSGSAEAPPLLTPGDYVMLQCTIFYTALPPEWSICKDADLFSNRANQPVFTALNDCLMAKGIEQDNDPTVWDDSQEDRDRGWADMLFCAVVDGDL